ncbi:hypothetical protein [Cyanobium sp. T1G-Tous]|uniref:hypothetical protein n=1 Tax=Cyanobium sp. T1G-Tous TaxID=2823722 RepID=UPI0020CE071A|nr:hypothetical protein [Cyanobium sp. T1G-Tous]
MPGRLVLLVHKERQEHQALLDHLGQQGQLASLVLRALLARKEIKVPLALKVPRALKERPACKAAKALKAPRDRKALQEIPVQQECKASWALLVQRGRKALQLQVISKCLLAFPMPIWQIRGPGCRLALSRLLLLFQKSAHRSVAATLLG